MGRKSKAPSVAPPTPKLSTAQLEASNAALKEAADTRAALEKLQTLLRLLGDDDFELKKLHVQRYLAAHETTNKQQMLSQLQGDGLLSSELVTRWDAIVDVDTLIAAARRANGNASNFRRPAAFTKEVKATIPKSTPRSTTARSSAAQSNRSATRDSSYRKDKGSSSARAKEPLVEGSEGPAKPLLKRLRSQRSQTAAMAATLANGASRDFRVELEGAGKLREIDWANNHDFAVLHYKHKAEACRSLAEAARTGVLMTVHLDSVRLDVGCADALAELLKAPRLRVLTVMNNRLNEDAVRLLAASLFDHTNLCELAIGDQSLMPLSTRAVKELLDAMATVPTLVKLRLGTINDDSLRRRYLKLETQHVEDMRKRHHDISALRARQAAGEPLESAERRLIKTADEREAKEAAAKKAKERARAEEMRRTAEEAEAAAKADAARAEERAAQKLAASPWAAEARRIAASEEVVLGKPIDGGRGTYRSERERLRGQYPSRSTYVLTGSVEWVSTLRTERRALIEAFASNTTFEAVIMSDCMIDDELAIAWAAVLSQPTCAVKSLRLESNPIATAGVEALAGALSKNTSLTALSLSNLHGYVSKEAEEAFGIALEHNTRLTKLSIDLRSWRARDEVSKWLARNEQIRREERGWNASASTKANSTDVAAGTPVTNGRAPMRHKSPQGQHVGIARDMWADFFGEGAEAAAAPSSSSASAAASTVAAAPSASTAGVSEPIFEPDQLPRVAFGTDGSPMLNGKSAAAANGTPDPNRPPLSISELAASAGRNWESILKRSVVPRVTHLDGQVAFDEDVEQRQGGASKKINPLAEAVAARARSLRPTLKAAVERVDEQRNEIMHASLNGNKPEQGPQALADMLESSGNLLRTQQDVELEAEDRSTPAVEKGWFGFG